MRVHYKDSFSTRLGADKVVASDAALYAVGLSGCLSQAKVTTDTGSVIGKHLLAIQVTTAGIRSTKIGYWVNLETAVGGWRTR